MKCWFLAFVSLTLIGANSTFAQRPRQRAASKNAWLTYTSPDRRFSVDFPGTVSEQQYAPGKELPYLVGTLVAHSPSPDRRFELNWVDFLGAIGSPADYKLSRIRSFIDAVTSHGGTVLSQTHVNTGGCQGEEAAVRMVNPANKVPSLVKVRFYSSAGNVFYLEYFGNSDSAEETATANRFLNSFKVFGGCRDAISVPAGANPMVWFSGTLDPETGWHRVDSPYGASFLFPEPGQLEWYDERGASGTIRHYTYEYRSGEYLFTVEIANGYRAANRGTTAQRRLELDRFLTAKKKELTAGGYRFGECKPLIMGDAAGSTCPLTLPTDDVTGGAQVIVAPTRTLFVTAFALQSSSNTDAVDRFLNSIELQPK